MSELKDLGSLLGIASFFGVAAMALLLFQLARDVRRLRDWAGRAPERAAMAAERASQEYSEQASDLRRLRQDVLGGPFWTRRNTALVGAAAVIAVIGVAVGLTSLLGGDDSSSKSSGQASGQKSGSPNRANRVVAGTIKVAVLNGTDVPGLAASVGDNVEENGFKLGAVTNSDQQFEFSVVMYERGHKREAQAVAKGLGISRTRLLSPQIRGLSGGANVTAIVGRDRATG